VSRAAGGPVSGGDEEPRPAGARRPSARPVGTRPVSARPASARPVSGESGPVSGGPVSGGPVSGAPMAWGPMVGTGVVRVNRRAGAYHELRVQVGQMAGRVRPGQFVTVAVGGRSSAALLRRAIAVCHADRKAGELLLVVAPIGQGTRWLCEQPVGARLALVGGLGIGFRYPAEPGECVLVGGGYGTAPLLWLGRVLRSRGNRVTLVAGAASVDRLYAPSGIRPQSERANLTTADAAHTVQLLTEDGRSGVAGLVTDPLPDLIGPKSTVYACGPMGMLAAVSSIAEAAGADCQVSVEEAMACGIGVCMTCVLPVRGDDGVTRMVRSCVEGPVFRGEQVRWDDIGTVPGDTFGAPAAVH
jgi:dihydroorotate dehydrogenase electron transfer subunit